MFLQGRHAVIQRSAIWFIEQEAALRGFHCLLIDYSSLQHSETLAEGKALY